MWETVVDQTLTAINVQLLIFHIWHQITLLGLFSFLGQDCWIRYIYYIIMCFYFHLSEISFYHSTLYLLNY